MASPYDRALDALADADPVSVTCLPDGSVDRHYRLTDAGTAVESREALAERLTEGDAKAFAAELRDVRPGGQAVNMAQQVGALGDEVTLFGHLDHEVFAFPFRAVTFGDPATVDVYGFEDGDLMVSEESDDIRSWTAHDLFAAGGRDALAADAVCCANWVSFPNMADALHAFADAATDGGVFVLDPGDVVGILDEEVRSLVDALASLADAYEVVLSANRDETDHLAGAVDGDGPAVERLRRAAGVAGVACHERERAVAATREGTVAVENLDVEEPVTGVGGGDRFSAALARALADDWRWPTALALGNACASYHVDHGESADCDDLRSYVPDRLSGRSSR